jgi:hypothetical protein
MVILLSFLAPIEERQMKEGRIKMERNKKYDNINISFFPLPHTYT